MVYYPDSFINALVKSVEHGLLEKKEAKAIAQGYFDMILASGCDCVIDEEDLEDQDD